jgi:hypothetical protein
MIPVTPANEPARFDADVRQKGLSAIDELVGRPPRQVRSGRQRPKIYASEDQIPAAAFPSYWRAVLPELMTAYNEVCAYSCFRIHPVTGGPSVDHFAAKSGAWDKVYEWTNYRLCSSRMNSRKREYGDVLDPFAIQSGWFCLELVGFSVVPCVDLDPERHSEVFGTIERLGLNDFRQDRAADAEKYWAGDVSLKTLRQESPFVASELNRNNRLNSGDGWV